MSFRFQAFADAPSARAAFEAAFSPGSPAEPALQALVDMGAQCKNAGPARVACRYVEEQMVLVCWCWHVALDRDAAGGLRGVRVTVAALGM
jgi:hypothetical protein